MTKQDAIERWINLEPNQDPYPHMKPIPYKATGSRYGACGIRIDGTPVFIDAVLSNLKTILQGEGMETRLELARNPVKPTNINGEPKTFKNATEQAEVCYIRIHERGKQTAHAERLIQKHLS